LSKILILPDAIHYMIRAYGSHAIASIFRNGLKSVVIKSVEATPLIPLINSYRCWLDSRRLECVL